MASNGVYSSDRMSGGGGSSMADLEYSEAVVGVGSFFATDARKHEDLKNMLDSNKDGLKLEAMKRIIGMVAKGKDASDLFPAVVKNVVSKNIEVKKLVYVYLVRYAEEKQDLALLSISTFQRALKDPNQLIRASALRVLSSIRVPVIVPIMMLAIKDAVNDMSPYVRKTTAHAIPKLYSLDPEQKDQLIEIIEKLLSDKTTLVVGSAVMAFEEVCPERIDLIHKNYKKLCNLLVDVEEWGQVEILHMLTRYARLQFIDPNKYASGDNDKAFYDSENSSHEKDDDDPDSSKKTYVMDQDHRLLLRNAKPLLQSRNSAVVVAVIRLYYYLAPRNEVNLVAKVMIRLLRSPREIQTIVLSNIATMSTKRKDIFEPYLRSFFIRSSDPTNIKLLKLEVLTNLATETNISVILREFQTYVSSSDMEFVAATIEAIGRCASTIKEVSDTCLNGLVSLLSNRNETVVAESVVVIKKLLQIQPSEHKDIICHMAKLMDNITVPMARASILWLLGEYADRVPKIAPDVLRKVAKSFINEEDIVKLQTLNLASKLYLTNYKQTKLLAQYVFSLAKYDQNYDIRDRARFLRQLIMPQGEKGSQLTKYAKKLLLTSKPAPLLQSKFQDRDQYQLGSLSHFINARARDYRDLPEFPEEAPDPSVRNVEVTPVWQEIVSGVSEKKKQVGKKKSFYSETETSSPEDESDSSEEESSMTSKEDSSGSDKKDSSESESDSGSLESDESNSEGYETIKKGKDTKKPDAKNKQYSSSEEEEEDDDDEDESTSGSSEEESSSTEEEAKPKPAPKKGSSSKSTKQIDLLLDLDDISTVNSNTVAPGPIPGLQPLLPTAFAPTTISSNNMPTSGPSISQVTSPIYVSSSHKELLNKFQGNGLTVAYRFTRGPNIYSHKMISVELVFTNVGTEAVPELCIPDKKYGSVEIKGVPKTGPLAVNASSNAIIGIDLNESTQPATFEIKVGEHTYPLSIKIPVGEILQPVVISKENFTSQQNKLRGMNENTGTIDLPGGNADSKLVTQKIYEASNVLAIESTDPTTGVYLFAGQTIASKCLVLITFQLLSNGKASLVVNCEKMVIGSMLLKELKEVFSR